MTSKPRVVKDFEKLDEAVQEQIKLFYPYGFEDHLVSFNNAAGDRVSALPFEAEDKYYLVRMTKIEAQNLIEEDDDYDDEGNLKDDVKEDYEEKHEDSDEEMGEDDEPLSEEFE